MAHVPPLPDSGSFSAPTQSLSFSGFLFDLDGTIIDSTDAIVKHWHKIAGELGVDASTILRDSHGRRSIDTLALYDTSRANWDYVNRIEGALPREYGADAVEIPGARAILDRLSALAAPWAIVTSGSDALMSGWLQVMNLPRPPAVPGSAVPAVVVAEDVEHGKPDPQCYRLGRQRIAIPEGARVLVVEDAPAGVRAGKAAGATVLGLATTHSIDRVREAGADIVVRDLRSVSVSKDEGAATFTVEFKDAWLDNK